MKPNPFSALNHFTVPCVMQLLLLGGQTRPHITVSGRDQVPRSGGSPRTKTPAVRLRGQVRNNRTEVQTATDTTVRATPPQVNSTSQHPHHGATTSKVLDSLRKR